MSDIERPNLDDDEADPQIWSNTSIGHRLTWRELVEHLRERLAHQSALAAVLADLDRCEHGRHAGDDCGSCGGPSHGNPHAPSGSIIGYGLGGEVIVQPLREKRADPEAWYLRRPSTSTTATIPARNIQ